MRKGYKTNPMHRLLCITQHTATIFGFWMRDPPAFRCCWARVQNIRYSNHTHIPVEKKEMWFVTAIFNGRLLFMHNICVECMEGNLLSSIPFRVLPRVPLQRVPISGISAEILSLSNSARRSCLDSRLKMSNCKSSFCIVFVLSFR